MPEGIFGWLLIGIAGALLAGFVAQSSGVTLDGFWRSYGAATLGAVVLLALYRLIIARRVR